MTTPSSYTLSWSDPTLKPNITLQQYQIDNQSASQLTLVGPRTGSWGLTMQQDLVRILERFCNSFNNPPANTTVGQMWYDWTKRHLAVCVEPGNGPTDRRSIYLLSQRVLGDATQIPRMGETFFDQATDSATVYNETTASYYRFG